MNSGDPSLFQQIQDLCIKKFWHLICHESSVATHGAYLRFQLGDSDLFIHNHNSNLSCYVNRCPHRGARIVNSPSGRSSLQCSYHGWSFQPSGTSVPRLETFADSLDPKGACLQQWNLLRFAGFIFVSFDPAFSLDDQIGDDAMCLLEQMGEWIQDCFSSQVIRFESPWMLAVENSLEAYHLPKAHPQTLAIADLDDGENTLWDWSSWHVSSPRNGIVSRLSSVIAKGVDLPSRINGYFSLYLFPFSMIVSEGSLFFSLQLYQPSSRIEDCQTTLKTSFYTPSVLGDHMLSSFNEYYSSKSEQVASIIREDILITSLVPLSSWSIEPLVYSSSLEVKVDHFRRCCKKALDIALSGL